MYALFHTHANVSDSLMVRPGCRYPRGNLFWRPEFGGRRQDLALDRQLSKSRFPCCLADTNDVVSVSLLLGSSHVIRVTDLCCSRALGMCCPPVVRRDVLRRYGARTRPPADDKPKTRTTPLGEFPRLAAIHPYFNPTIIHRPPAFLPFLPPFTPPPPRPPTPPSPCTRISIPAARAKRSEQAEWSRQHPTPFPATLRTPATATVWETGCMSPSAVVFVSESATLTSVVLLKVSLPRLHHT